MKVKILMVLTIIIFDISITFSGFDKNWGSMNLGIHGPLIRQMPSFGSSTFGTVTLVGPSVQPTPAASQPTFMLCGAG